MVDHTPPKAASAELTCPWCSAKYTGDPETCPSCGAALALDPTTESSLPGLTAIDAAAIVRAKTPVARPRNRILSWISGEYPDDVPSVIEAGALAPPDPDVRREMLRLELEAEVANLQAEADALLADATIEGRLPEAPTQEAPTQEAARQAAGQEPTAQEAAAQEAAAQEAPMPAAAVEAATQPGSGDNEGPAQTA